MLLCEILKSRSGMMYRLVRFRRFCHISQNINVTVSEEVFGTGLCKPILKPIPCKPGNCEKAAKIKKEIKGMCRICKVGVWNRNFLSYRV